MPDYTRQYRYRQRRIDRGEKEIRVWIIDPQIDGGESERKVRAYADKQRKQGRVKQ